VLLLALLLGQALGLPEVENPIPEKIGLEDVFAVAGAGGVLGSIVRFRSTSAKRERGIMWGVLGGFCFGAAAYLLSLAVQVLSS
jgi:hypothetical protein